MQSSLPRLSMLRLGAMPADVRVPHYNREELNCGIVHIGLGAFARAHLLVATERAITRANDLHWGVVGVSLRNTDTRDALHEQDGLYTVSVNSADAAGNAKHVLQVVGCLVRVLVAPENPQAVLDLLAAKNTKVASLTITEKGYHLLPGRRALDWQHPDVAHDLINPVPRTAVGYLVRGLMLRRRLGNASLNIVSLDNLPCNGDTIKALVLEFAKRVDENDPNRSTVVSLVQWIEHYCRFPNSMVDRIVPKTVEQDRQRVSEKIKAQDHWPVMAEPFSDWVLEDRFASGRPAWNLSGVRFVKDVAPWETLKLRMVNGSHSAIAYLAVMAGWATVDQAMQQPSLRGFIAGLMEREIAPSVPKLPGLDVEQYKNELLERFSNPALKHKTLQIAMDGSQKIPQRLLGTIRDRMAAGQPINGLVLALAAWLHYLRGHDEAGNSYAIEDPMAQVLKERANASLAMADHAERATHWLAMAEVFSTVQLSVPLLASLSTALGKALKSLDSMGVQASLEACIAENYVTSQAADT